MWTNCIGLCDSCLLDKKGNTKYIWSIRVFTAMWWVTNLYSSLGDVFWSWEKGICVATWSVICDYDSRWLSPVQQSSLETSAAPQQSGESSINKYDGPSTNWKSERKFVRSQPKFSAKQGCRELEAAEIHFWGRGAAWFVWQKCQRAGNVRPESTFENRMA